jgi:hypothetical protein
VSDYTGNPIGVWSSFKADHGTVVRNNGYFRIHQERNGGHDVRFMTTEMKDGLSQKNISYLKIDGCYLREIHIEPNINHFLKPSNH